MRARITRELIARRGFSFVAVEADWPDAARDRRLRARRAAALVAGVRSLRALPDLDVAQRGGRTQFVDWLRAYNADHPERKAGFHGLDLYSLFTSIAAVLAYLDDVDPDAARVARHRYGGAHAVAEGSRGVR